MVRRGLDPDEVRERIRSLDAEIERLRERANQLDQDLATARRPQVAIDNLSPDELVALIGDEAATLLSQARSEAAGVRQRAEDEAVEIVAAAYEEAARVRESVQQEIVYLQRTTAEQVESELASARARGLDMVTEAREYREKVLSDLAQRRDLARAQIRALVDGRDHLLRAFEVARLAAVDIIVELEQAAPTEDAAEREERLAREVAESAIYDADSDLTPVGGVALPTTSGPVLVDSDPDRERRDVVLGNKSEFGGASEPAKELPVGLATDRARVLRPLVESLAKQFKRVAVDEQNDVLTAIRRSEGITRLDELLLDEESHIDRYARAARSEVHDAAAAGAVSMGVEPPSSVDEVFSLASHMLAEELILPMRERLERVIDSSQGNRFELSAFVRSVYREWKQRFDSLADEMLLQSYGAGAYRSLPEGSLVVWASDGSTVGCAGGHTNVGVVIRVPEVFPSGHQYPPISARCRCLIERVAE